MGTGFSRVLRIGVVCAVALALVAQPSGAASKKQSVRPIAGTFNGSDNENGVVTSWNGSVKFATAATRHVLLHDHRARQVVGQGHRRRQPLHENGEWSVRCHGRQARRRPLVGEG